MVSKLKIHISTIKEKYVIVVMVRPSSHPLNRLQKKRIIKKGKHNRSLTPERISHALTSLIPSPIFESTSCENRHPTPHSPRVAPCYTSAIAPLAALPITQPPFRSQPPHHASRRGDTRRCASFLHATQTDGSLWLRPPP